MQISITEQKEISNWLDYLINRKTPNRIFFENDSVIVQYSNIVDGHKILLEIHIISNLFSQPFYYFSIDKDGICQYGGKYNITFDLIDKAFNWFDDIYHNNIDWNVLYSNDNPEKIVKMEIK